MTKTDVRLLDIKAGEVLDEFSINRFIGKGLSDTARTYEAQDDTVIKLYTGDLKPSSFRYEKFKNEPVLLREMAASPYVISPITDFRERGTHEGIEKLAPYYAMERMDGNIEKLVIDPNLSLASRLSIALQIVRGMADCHAQKICHRDIYTPNVLYRNEGGEFVCKIADFGSGKQHGVPQSISYFKPTGNTSYTSPEAIVGLMGGDDAEFEIMAAGDIFALGLLLYELITGVKQEKLYVALVGLVSIAQSADMWDASTTHNDRKEYLQNTVLPILNSVKINEISADDIMTNEETAIKLNELVMSMIQFDHSSRQTDLDNIISQIENALSEVDT